MTQIMIESTKVSAKFHRLWKQFHLGVEEEFSFQDLPVLWYLQGLSTEGQYELVDTFDAKMTKYLNVTQLVKKYLLANYSDFLTNSTLSEPYFMGLFEALEHERLCSLPMYVLDQDPDIPENLNCFTEGQRRSLSEDNNVTEEESSFFDNFMIIIGNNVKEDLTFAATSGNPLSALIPPASFPNISQSQVAEARFLTKTQASSLLSFNFSLDTALPENIMDDSALLRGLNCHHVELVSPWLVDRLAIAYLEFAASKTLLDLDDYELIRCLSERESLSEGVRLSLDALTSAQVEPFASGLWRCPASVIRAIEGRKRDALSLIESMGNVGR